MTHLEKVRNYKYYGRPLSIDRLKNSIRAMKTLIVLYQQRDYRSDCPLCCTFCHYCPWVVLTEDGDCIAKGVVLSELNEGARIGQLRRWIKVYETVLKERKK